MIDIHTSALTCCGVGLVFVLLIRVHSMQSHTIRSPPGPAPEPLDAPRHVPELPGDGGLVVDGRVDVEGDDVAAPDVLGIVFGMVGPHAPAVPAVPGHALAEIEHHRPRGVLGLDLAGNPR